MSLRLASLSRRERQVLAGLVEGQTNKEIARQFELSPRTVEVYRAKLMTKMQASNISELVRFAMRAGVTGG
jgi:two-component system response regulator FixJ